MTHAILTVEEFLAAFHVGDMFWHMRRLLGEPPSGIEGPCTILAFTARGRRNLSCVKCRVLHGHAWKVEEHYIRDVTNEWHGVFLAKDHASAYFNERTAAYKSDPALVKEAADARGRATRPAVVVS